jgi:hypothetical protein
LFWPVRLRSSRVRSRGRTGKLTKSCQNCVCLFLSQDPCATLVPFVKAIVDQHPELGVSVDEAFPKIKVAQVDSLSELLSYGHADSSSSTSISSKHSLPGPAWKLTKRSGKVS